MQAFFFFMAYQKKYRTFGVVLRISLVCRALQRNL